MYNSLSDGSVKMLIGNKSDLAEMRQVAVSEAEAFAEANGLAYFETSAKTASNVEEAFVAMAQEIQKRLEDGTLERKV